MSAPVVYFIMVNRPVARILFSRGRVDTGVAMRVRKAMEQFSLNVGEEVNRKQKNGQEALRGIRKMLTPYFPANSHAWFS